AVHAPGSATGSSVSPGATAVAFHSAACSKPRLRRRSACSSAYLERESPRVARARTPLHVPYPVGPTSLYTPGKDALPATSRLLLDCAPDNTEKRQPAPMAYSSHLTTCDDDSTHTHTFA